MEDIHEDLDKFSRENYDPSDIPESVGHYFDSEFKKWIKVSKMLGHHILTGYLRVNKSRHRYGIGVHFKSAVAKKFVYQCCQFF